MPRARKVPIAPNSTTYGERQELEQMQDVDAAPRATIPSGQLQQMATQAAAALPSQMPPGGYLKQPSARPNEPLQAGLASGPGPGPEVLQTPTRSQQLRRQIEAAAETTNNPVLRRMARQVGQRPAPRPPMQR